MTADRATWLRAALSGHVGAACSATPPSSSHWKEGRDPGSGTEAAEAGVSGFVFVCFSAATPGVVRSLARSRFTVFMQTSLKPMLYLEGNRYFL